MGRVQASLRIKGRVQGVFFRYSAKAEANRLGLTGWIRNREDGDVEAIAEGSASSVREFVAWCRKGPPGAGVEEVEVEESAASNQFSTFRVEH